MLVFTSAFTLLLAQPAFAVPGAADCEVLRYECRQGNEQKCRIVYRYCDVYYPENSTPYSRESLFFIAVHQQDKN